MQVLVAGSLSVGWVPTAKLTLMGKVSSGAQNPGTFLRMLMYELYRCHQ